ncbi:hypothetical protein DCC27_003290 [Auritidibacter sp. NML130574]|nr:hypothetical protein DCC27_003290 [Auritidibacter sp. NML130574]
MCTQSAQNFLESHSMPIEHDHPAAHHDSAGSATESPRSRRIWPWVLGGGIVVLGVGVYVGTAMAFEDRLPANFTVEGIDVSGMNVDQAQQKVEDELDERASRELTLVGDIQSQDSATGDETPTVDDATQDDVTATVVPEEIGLDYDVDGVLQEYRGLNFSPVVLWQRLTGEGHREAETTIDESQATEALRGLSEQMSQEPVEGSVTFNAGDVAYQAPVSGVGITAEGLASHVEENWLQESEEIHVQGETLEPQISADTWQSFVENTAEPLVADSYTVTAGEASTELTPEQLGEAAQVDTGMQGPSATADSSEDSEESEASTDSTGSTASMQESSSEGTGDATPSLELDEDSLVASLEANEDGFASSATDATVKLSGKAGSARPEVVPGESGTGIAGEEVADAIEQDLAQDQTRSVEVEVKSQDPEVTTEDAEAWDVTHEVAEFSTPYPDDPTRTPNLEVGAERVNGTVVMPGEEFNLAEALGPVTEANGYVSSGVVQSGVTAQAVGGGVSQIATMAYNAGFLSGMDIKEHRPHSRWFDRYPKGRESTFWEGQINVRWLNDTDAPVIVEMWLDDEKVHVRVWGNDYYDVSMSTSEPYNYTNSQTITSSEPNCVPEAGGRQGFTVDVTRSRTDPEGNTDDESWTWTYSAWPRVICQ